MAGIGWIVKSALLITEQYGASIRLSTILTDAVLETAAPVNVSRCGDCAACVKKCPGQAILGRNWEAGMSRNLFFDAGTCYRTVKAYAIKRQYRCRKRWHLYCRLPMDKKIHFREALGTDLFAFLR